jgi:NADH:ubiquinone oxidoreductase subunit 5 (subunit L)/multisubunit Na+/H+ antiporter MnhA subunit
MCRSESRQLFFFFKQRTAYEMLRSLVGSTLLAAAAAAAAIVLYVRRDPDPARLRAHPAVAPLHRLLERKYYADVLAEDLLVRRVFYGGLAKAAHTFDVLVIDGVVNGAARGTFLVGWFAKFAQNGQAQTAAAALLAGGVVIFGVVVILQ